MKPQDDLKDEMAFDPDSYERLRKLAADMRVLKLGPSTPMSIGGGLKRGELLILGGSLNTGRSSFFHTLKARAENGKHRYVIDLECNPLDFHTWKPASFEQSYGRLVRQVGKNASRRWREGCYIGHRKGKAYRAKTFLFGRPKLHWTQVEREVWRRLDLKEKANES